LELKDWILLNQTIVIEEYKKINNLSNEDYEKEKLILFDAKNNKIKIKYIKQNVQNIAKELYNKYVEDFNSKNNKKENKLLDNVKEVKQFIKNKFFLKK
jgi:hypothetical protein